MPGRHALRPQLVPEIAVGAELLAANAIIPVAAHGPGTVFPYPVAGGRVTGPLAHGIPQEPDLVRGQRPELPVRCLQRWKIAV